MISRNAQPADVPAINALAARSIRALHAHHYGESVMESAIEHAYGCPDRQTHPSATGRGSSTATNSRTRSCIGIRPPKVSNRGIAPSIPG
jgi:hypothetical protein